MARVVQVTTNDQGPVEEETASKFHTTVSPFDSVSICLNKKPVLVVYALLAGNLAAYSHAVGSE